MGTNRRRFITATGAVLLAGCNEQSEPEREATVTPADVPRSADDILKDVETIPVPTVEAGPVVSDSHRQSVARQAEDRVETAETELAGADDVDLDAVDGLRQTEAPFGTAREQIRDYRDTSDPRRFIRLRNAVRDMGVIIGHVRAATGVLGVDGLRTALDDAQAEYVALGQDADYRLASPVIDLLPTLAAAEASLERASDRRRAAERRFPDESGGGTSVAPAEVARVWGLVETVRLESTNAGGYIQTSLDDDAPSRDAGISAAITENLEALRSLEVPRRADGGPLPSQVQTVLSSTRARRSEVFAAADPTEPESANRVELLLEAASLRGQFEAFEVAGEETFARLEGETFPAERIPDAKRLAVDRVEALSNGAPLQRHLGGLADDMVTFADRIRAGMGNAPVASAHFMYVSGRAFAEVSLSRGESLADRLAPDRATDP